MYALSLMVVGGAPLLNQGAAYWALPALLGCVQAHYAPRPSARLAAPLLGIVVALTLLGSHPQQALIAWLPAVFYVLYLVLRSLPGPARYGASSPSWWPAPWGRAWPPCATSQLSRCLVLPLAPVGWTSPPPPWAPSARSLSWPA